MTKDESIELCEAHDLLIAMEELDPDVLATAESLLQQVGLVGDGLKVYENITRLSIMENLILGKCGQDAQLPWDEL